MDPLSVAHIGHVDAARDHARWLAVYRWLQDNDRQFFDLLHAQEERGELEQHFIDLNLWGEENEGYNIRSGGAAQSVYHTADNWRRRLCATGARYIVLAGNAF